MLSSREITTSIVKNLTWISPTVILLRGQDSSAHIAQGSLSTLPSCHDMTLTTQAGPAIGTVYGRLAANTNYNYSTSMGGSRRQFRWSKPRLYIFLCKPHHNCRGPRGYVSGDKHDLRRTEELIRTCMHNRVPALAEEPQTESVIYDCTEAR